MSNSSPEVDTESIVKNLNDEQRKLLAEIYEYLGYFEETDIYHPKWEDMHYASQEYLEKLEELFPEIYKKFEELNEEEMNDFQGDVESQEESILKIMVHLYGLTNETANILNVSMHINHAYDESGKYHPYEEKL